MRSGYAVALGIALLVLAAGLGWLVTTRQAVSDRGPWGQQQAEPAAQGPKTSRLNPHGFPPAAACAAISIEDPVAEAKTNIAKGDRRPFTVHGFTPGDVPGVYCPSGDYRLEGRGGTFVSDMPDACGRHIFSHAPAETMAAYNRALASDPQFQAITGCRAATYCEERYRKGRTDRRQRDPRCPGEPEVLMHVAANGTAAALADVLADFGDGAPTSRDALTVAFIAAMGHAQWPNAEMLLRAGADVNGRAHDRYPDQRRWLGSPLEALFDQNDDRAGKIGRARWLFAHGANFDNPDAHRALVWAASANDVEAVQYLLATGASPNGPQSSEELDRLAGGDIRSAGGGPGYGMTPFYQALAMATQKWSRDTPAEIAHADAERRKGRINAIILYRAGGRFFVGMLYDDLRREPDIKTASILLAAAQREGRLRALIERILYPNGRERPLDPGKTAGERALVAYLRKVEGCGDIRPVPQGDHIKLCRGGDV